VRADDIMRRQEFFIDAFPKAALHLLTVSGRVAACLALCTFAVLPSPARALDSSQLAVIVNTLDPLSVQIGEYYAVRRHIIFQNVIRVAFAPGSTTLTSKEFDAIKVRVDEQALPHIHAFALTWAAPYRVECMSITSAFAFGFDPAFCAKDCKTTRPSPYFNSRAQLPFTQLRMRPTMAIAATSFERARALIDRGVESDGSQPSGTAYLLSTSDISRNVRSASYPLVERLFKGKSIPVVPILLNTYYPPNAPTARRSYDIGRKIARIIEQSKSDLRVAVAASGGLSHFVVDENLDRKILHAIEKKDAETLRSLSRDELNSGSSEILNWVMVAGMSEKLNNDWSEYYPGRRTPAGTGTGMAFATWS